MPGDLAETSPVDLCLQLAGDRATGTLAVSGSGGRAVLVFADGQLAGAGPPEAGHRGPLGERLVGLGRLDRADLDALLAEPSAPPTAMGPLLVARGLASPDAVRLVVQEQVLDTMLEILGWFEGQWDFRDAVHVHADAVDVRLPVDRALAEVRRRAAERERVARLVPSSVAVPTPVTGATSPTPLPADAAAVLATVDGERTVGEIATALGTSPDEVSRQLFRLALQELVAFADTDRTIDHPASTTEDAALHAAALTGSPPVHLADDGWAERRHDAVTAADEPEPWVGWAYGSAQDRVDLAPAAEPAPTPPPAAAAPPAAATPEPPAPEPPAPEPAAPEPAAPAESSAQHNLDADTRRALFSELHEVGRANPTLGGDAPRPDTTSAAPQPQPEPAPEPEAPAVRAPTPDPSSLSRSDVSELLRELHALNLDD